MIDFQEQYYHQIGSKKSAKHWGSNLIKKMLIATHVLWMKRNHIHMLHLTAENCIRGLNNIALQTAVEQQYILGHQNMDEDDFYLLDDDMETSMGEPVEMIVGWLCEILISRGDFDSARLESLKDRGKISHIIPILNERKYNSY